MRITAKKELTAHQLDEARRIAWMHDRHRDIAPRAYMQIGEGHYSTVYHLDNELVVKVGGTAGYGQHRNSSRGKHEPSFFLEELGHEAAHDPWPDYLMWVGNMRRVPTWAPRVYHFEWMRHNRGVYFAIMERLYKAPQGVSHRTAAIKPVLKHTAEKAGFRLDLHDGNVMSRPGYRTQVVTDPWCGSWTSW